MDDDEVLARLDAVWRQHVPGDPRVELARWREVEPDQEYRLGVVTPTMQRLVIVALGRYGLTPYQRPRMKSTVCIDAPISFVRKHFWPLFKELASVIEEHERDTMQRLMKRWLENADAAGPS